MGSTVRELLYGGGAGGGKTDGLLMGPVQFLHLPRFKAGLFRRTYPELEASLIERSRNYYYQFGGRYNETKHTWRFPSGAQVVFRALQYVKDVFAHQSDEFQYLGFDELTHFEEKQYRYLLSRLRGPVDYPLCVRAGTNPDVCWVKDRWAPWVNRSSEYLDSGAPIADSGEVLWVLPDGMGGESYVPEGTPKAFSRCFIRSSRHDTPQITEEYETQLLMQDAVQRARLMDGDWEAVPAAGKYYKRDWCLHVNADDVPNDARFVRHWDRAATEKSEKSSDPDWTVGVLMARKGTQFWVVNVLRVRETPKSVDDLMLRTANSDGKGVVISLAQDPGQAGKDQVHRLVRMLSGWRVQFSRETGDKVRRFGPFSSQAEHGNVRIVRAGWNEAYNYELESFPEGRHDDQVDGTSGAFRRLTVSSDGGMGTDSLGLY